MSNITTRPLSDIGIDVLYENVLISVTPSDGELSVQRAGQLLGYARGQEEWLFTFGPAQQPIEMSVPLRYESDTTITLNAATDVVKHWGL